MRFQYRHPRLYHILISLIYPPGLMAEVRRVVGEGQTVFEVAAGYGRLAAVIHPSNRYHGIDLNEIFVAYGRRHGRDLTVQDIFEPEAYRLSDVFLLVDIIHHLTMEQLRAVFGLVFAHADRKVVIVEPAFVGITRRYGVFGRLLDRAFKFVDDDGFNHIQGWMTNQEYSTLLRNRFGATAGHAFDLHHHTTYLHHVVTFTRAATL